MVCHITLWIAVDGTVDFDITYTYMYLFNGLCII